MLVATETGDDAGVYLLGRALGPLGVGIVQTADFITPPFDDPEAYGQIAAANALSDVYAMGGRPSRRSTCACFPPSLTPSAARAILRGASDKLHEAGAVLLGGHTVRGPELYSVFRSPALSAPGSHLAQRRRAAGRRAVAHQAPGHRARRDGRTQGPGYRCRPRLVPGRPDRSKPPRRRILSGFRSTPPPM